MKIVSTDIYLLTCPEKKVMWKVCTPDMMGDIESMLPFSVFSLEMVQKVYGTGANYFYYDSACNCYLWYVPPNEAQSLKLKSQMNTGSPDFVVMPYFKVFERWFQDYDNVVLVRCGAMSNDDDADPSGKVG
jgi:hypothetical protein